MDISFSSFSSFSPRKQQSDIAKPSFQSEIVRSVLQIHKSNNYPRRPRTTQSLIGGLAIVCAAISEQPKEVSPCKRCEKPGYALNQSYSLYNDTNAFCSCCRWSGLLNQSKKKSHEQHEQNRYDCENNKLNGHKQWFVTIHYFFIFFYLVIIFVNSCQ